MSLLRRRMMMQYYVASEDVPLDTDLSIIFGIQQGYMLMSGGGVMGWMPGVVSDYIPCEPCYVFELKTTCATWTKVCFYDSGKNFISANSLGKYEAGTFQFGKGTQYEIPEEAKYLMVQLRGENTEDYYIKRIM